MTAADRGLIARINRKLAHDGERLRVNREGSAAHQNFGRFCIVAETSAVVADHVDLQVLAREVKA